MKKAGVVHVGERYGMLVVLADQVKVGRVWLALCACDCGNRKMAHSYCMRSGILRSCGCRNSNKPKHGMHKTSEYRSWKSAVSRVTNPNDPSFASYGGRGIGICDRWLVFANFIADMGKKPTREHSIDRIDNDAGYSPENCRWATMAEQSLNKRNSKKVTVGGVTKNISQWAKELGCCATAVHRRIERGWTEERAVTTPPMPKPRRIKRVINNQITEIK